MRYSFDHLNNHRHHLTETKAGRVDLLGSIGKESNVLFEDLATDAIHLAVFGVNILCISIEQLIHVKRELGRPRDLAAVLELEAIQKLKAAT